MAPADPLEAFLKRGFSVVCERPLNNAGTQLVTLAPDRGAVDPRARLAVHSMLGLRVPPARDRSAPRPITAMPSLPRRGPCSSVRRSAAQRNSTMAATALVAALGHVIASDETGTDIWF